MLILEIVLACIAVVLIMLSVWTLQTIKHLGVGKSFWMPMAVSGFFFFFGSIVAILFELNFSLTTYTDEVVQLSRLLALSIMVGGVYSYARKISKNLGETFAVAQRVVRSGGEEKEVSPAAPAPAPIQERLSVIQENLKRKAAQECLHQFGYLRTLPKDAPIPDECLSCDKIIECKHSLTKTLKSQASPPPEA